MSLKNLFTINALVALLFGLGLLAAPTTIVSTIAGAILEPLGVHIARELGTMVLAVSLISWVARKAERSQATNAIVVGFSFTYPVLAIVAVISILNGVLAPTYWVNVFLFALLTIGFWTVGRPNFSA